MASKTVMQLCSAFMLIMSIMIISVCASSSSQLELSPVTINHGPWAEALENWITLQSNNSRAARVIHINNKTVTVSKIATTGKKDISETDLYLLAAIEKLTYRVDRLEKRLRRAEELIYYIIAGNNKMKEPCPENYTRMGQNCYYFSNRDFDQHSSASLCRGMGGHLVEFDTIEESQDVIAGLMSDSKLKGNNFWTGGVNPGLLWLWFDTGRPIHQSPNPYVTDKRCLMLTFNASSKIYSYSGENCGLRQRYICELTTDGESANKIERAAEMLLHKNN